MNKQSRIIGVFVLLLIVSVGNFSRNLSQGNIRTVDFLNIWAIGAISGLLIYKVIELIKKNK